MSKWCTFGRLQYRPTEIPENTNPRFCHSKAFRVVTEQNTLRGTPGNDEVTTFIKTICAGSIPSDDCFFKQVTAIQNILPTTGAWGIVCMQKRIDYAVVYTCT